MKMLRLFSIICFVAIAPSAWAYYAPDHHEKSNQQRVAEARMDCSQATAQVDLNINNVRARLQNGGDLWWDFSDGKYIIPNVDPLSGQPEVSSLFAGAVWIGGVDPAGGLKLACQAFRTSGNDFWPGPLTADGEIFQETCTDWDRFFTVTGQEVRDHRDLFDEKSMSGAAYNPGELPSGIKNWPAFGNPYFEEDSGYQLPDFSIDLAPFFDQDLDGIYDPTKGDFPIVEIRGCDFDAENAAFFPDVMYFWIYNDAGNIHTNTNADAIRMEVQVQAFAYTTSDQINDMTFYRYKLINRARERIDSTYFAMWVDPDLGCSEDDYVGCDTLRSLAYVYNQDALDGNSGTNCNTGGGSTETYGDNIPMIGIDYFRGPLGPFIFTADGDTVQAKLDQQADTLLELGMSSFTYYNRAGGGFTGLAATTDPNQPQEYYNYLTGTWRDRTPYTFGGNGYNVGSTANTAYAFFDPPNRSGGWSMWETQQTAGDRRTIQASGPFRLDPGAVNELIVGVPWVANVAHPGPSLSKMLEADDLAQSLFDNCFQLNLGPTAPDVDWIELDEQIVGILTNDVRSNNFKEEYEEKGLAIPEEADDQEYRFQGYFIYQLANANVTRAEFDNPELAVLVYQSDIQDEVDDVYNWSPLDDPNGGQTLFFPELEVEGGNEGIRHTFTITEDAFREGGLVNQRKYYFTAVAYAYNNYTDFDPIEALGQKNPYIEGRLNIKTYTVIPRPIVYETLNSDYGDGVEITRLDGEGAGGRFLDVTESYYDDVLAGDFNGEITYQAGEGPISVQVYNPLEIVDGEYLLTFTDNSTDPVDLETSAGWALVRTDAGGAADTIFSDVSIAALNEQLIREYGFSITLGQTGEPGELITNANGAIGYEESYADPAAGEWLFGISDKESGGVTILDEREEGTVALPNIVFNYARTAQLEEDFLSDPFQGLSTIGSGYFLPYKLCAYQGEMIQGQTAPLLTPAWTSSRNSVARSGGFAELPNVDIVFTSDKSKWSRCVVLEGFSRFFEDPNFGLGYPAVGDARHFELRALPSVGKEDANNDGLPDVDDAVDAQGRPITGMGWFPGFAVNVETGKRLNIFFQENSFYSTEVADRAAADGLPLAYADAIPRGGDMMFNPGSQLIVPFEGGGAAGANLFSIYMGGQHALYVTSTEYDECEFLRQRLGSRAEVQMGIALRSVQWAGFVMANPGQSFRSLNEGLVPNDLTVKLRVDNKFAKTTDQELAYNGYPTYRFSFAGVESDEADTETELETALDNINVVPNPYLAYSEYEVSQFSTVIKITNLPAKCNVTIYSVDGKFVRRYVRNESELPIIGTERAVRTTQITPALEWDMKNSRGIPIGSGVYLIHIDAGDQGERVIKWMGVNRQFDARGL